MRSHSPSTATWQIFIIIVLFFLWLGLFGLLIIAHGDLEGFLRQIFGQNSRPDAFYDLSRVSLLFWVVHSSLTITAVAAARSRRSDVLAILLIGPAIGLAISLLWQRWGDPNWAVFVGVCLVGWLVGTIVGGAYWFIRSK
jgi:hypothetical protein